MNVKIIKLVSSEELIGDWNEETKTIINPVVMVPIAKAHLAFQPWIPYAEEEEAMTFKEQHIVVVVTPDTKLQNEYSRVYGSGLLVPEEKIIH